MKRTLKILGFALAILAALVAMGATYFQIKGIPSYQAEIPSHIASLRVEADSARIARGANIATMMCKECHAGQDGKLTGRMMNDLPKELGQVASLNITKDPEHGIGKWTDGELYYFLRTGIRTDGSWSPPFMPKFVQMADEDLYSIIAWLRSNDPALEPDSREFPPNKFNLLVKFLGNVAFFPPALPAQPIVVPDTSDMVALGRYVANGMADCYSCHSEDFKKNDIVHPEKSAGFYGGGNPMLNQEGEVVPSANITMDQETGIGTWTEQQFLEAVKYGKNPRGGTLQYPMTPRTVLTDTEVRAIFAYLKTIPVIRNPIDGRR